MANKRLFFDIETSPNVGTFWRPGYKVRLNHDNILVERAILCICWKWEGKKKVHALEWDRDFSGGIGAWDDKALVTEFSRVIMDADEIIAQNGDRFDIPWLRGRCAFHGVDCPPQFTTLDTLKKAKGALGLNSYRLDYLGKFFGVGGKMDTGDGYDLWRDVCFGDEATATKAMGKMVRYCKRDVELLERVFQKMSPYITANTHHGVIRGKDSYCCPECGTGHGYIHRRRTTLAGTVKFQMRCSNTSCGKFYTINGRQRARQLEDQEFSARAHEM